jgi:hypothetical protein
MSHAAAWGYPLPCRARAPGNICSEVGDSCNYWPTTRGLVSQLHRHITVRPGRYMFRHITGREPPLAATGTER